MKIIRENRNNEKGDRSGLLLESERMIYSFMGHGKELDELNINFLNILAQHVNNLASNGDPESIGLWEWVRNHFSIASATSVWGPLNPLAVDSTLCEDFWTIEKYLMALFFMPFPAISIRKGYLAQQRLFNAWIQYGLNDGWKTGSQFAKSRAQLSFKYRLTKKMYGLNENSVLSALLVNTVPSAFWLLSYIFADPKLLIDIRQEIDKCVHETNSGKQKFISSTLLKTQCPLLNSALRETLRIIGPMNINRAVLEDTLLTNHSTGETFLLKRGGIVTVATNVIHVRSEVFGADANSFNARRFYSTVKTQSNSNDPKVVDIAASFRDEEGKVHSGSFRTFGGGSNICPGRHFAHTEMLSLTALFVAGFEIKNEYGGEYVQPPLAEPQILQGVIKPKNDVQVNVKRREGYEHVHWMFEL
ncbi:hypothetical protein M433DRAFT_149844 [Acidomyces richmondensis BFW]|nr:hypothetical protein M433DRAFT_149844 [Acidomyces richmondensis BFW]